MINAQTILPLVKQSLRMNNVQFDEIQLPHLIEAAQQDLQIAGVVIPERMNAIVNEAIVTYVILHFGLPEDAARLKQTYDEQKAQLSNATGFTDWSIR